MNSLFTYGDNYGVKIHSADSKDFKIIWKTFHSSITLILIEPLLPVNEQFYFNKIDILFNALVLLYGLDDLVNIANTEKFKKEIKVINRFFLSEEFYISNSININSSKVTYNILDAILHNSGKFDLFGGYLTGCTDALVINDSNVLQASIDESCLAVNTSLGCVMVNGRVIVASRTWWDLNATEAYLISLLCLTLSDSTSRDIPIYLPYKSPNEALRLLTYNLTSNNVMLCFICEEKPTIDAVEPLIKTLWHPIYKSLINLKQYFPRNLPPNLNLDDNMIGFLLINKNSKCCYSSLCPNETRSIHIDEMNKRYDLLRFCYLNITTNYFTKYFKDSGNRADENDGNFLFNLILFSRFTSSF